MAATAVERLSSLGIGAACGTLAAGQPRAAPSQWGPTGRACRSSASEGEWGPYSRAACWKSWISTPGQGPAHLLGWPRGAGGAGRTSVRAQAARKQSGKVALVGKKLQLKPPTRRPDQKEEGEPTRIDKPPTRPPSEARKEEARATVVQPTEREMKQDQVVEKPTARPPSEARKEEADLPIMQPSEAERKQDQGAQPEAQRGTVQEAETSTAVAEGPAREQAGEVEAKPGGAGQSAEEQAAELQALRKALQGAPGGEPARSSTALYAGVLEEIRLINWPPLGQVAGTTALVMAMLVGSSIVLTALNYGLSEGTKAFFEDGPLRDAVKSSLGL